MIPHRPAHKLRRAVVERLWCAGCLSFRLGPLHLLRRAVGVDCDHAA